jgi:hypothetical protein
MTTPTGWPAASYATECRISFRQPVDRSGSVDAGWWPRSDDLTAELPALLDVLWTAARDMRRVIYNIDSWAPAPRQMIIERHRVRLDGHHEQDPLVLVLIDAGGNDSARLLAIPFITDPAIAEELLRLASEPGNTHTARQLIDMARP